MALSSKAGDEAAQVKKAAESATAELRQSLQKEHDRAEALAGELAKARRDIETQVALSSKAGDEAAQLKQGRRERDGGAATVAAEGARQGRGADERACEGAAGHRDAGGAVEQDGRRGGAAEAGRRERDGGAATVAAEGARQGRGAGERTGEARRDIETQVALSSKAGDEAAQREAGRRERDGGAATVSAEGARQGRGAASELAKARRDIETQVALSSKTGDEAAQVKKAAESATAELRQSLQKEHDRAEALTSELAKAQRDIETQVALSSKAGDEAAQLKQLKEAAESATAELRQSLQKERDRAEALAPVVNPHSPRSGRAIAVERASNSQIAEVTQAAEAAATEQPAAAEAQGNPEAARLLARASALVGQGNIGAARIVLERAVETGSAQASFMLAETYDPLVLSTWKTYGTRGDVTKARELYAKALAGGIQEAKDRSVALR